MLLRVTMSMLLAVIGSIPAAAQPARDAAHNQSIGAGTQWALPYAGRGNPGVQVSWRRWFSPHVGIGTDVRWWGMRTTTEFNVPAHEGPGGTLIPSIVTRDDRRRSSYGVGAGVVARGWMGRLSLIAGAGPAFFADRTTYARRVDDRHESGSSPFRSFGAYMLAEAEVRATSRLSVFAGFRAELLDVRVFESSFAYPTAGVRFAF